MTVSEHLIRLKGLAKGANGEQTKKTERFNCNLRVTPEIRAEILSKMEDYATQNIADFIRYCITQTTGIQFPEKKRTSQRFTKEYFILKALKGANGRRITCNEISKTANFTQISVTNTINSLIANGAPVESIRDTTGGMQFRWTETPEET
ncbi:MAG TPA: hypothetical protein O0X39_01180 [Methanocorpusculum sp.]|nr:hypothetical protein [Methanocorpusculum sp.]